MRKILFILVLVVGLFSLNAEEIGIPYFSKSKGQINSAVLAPDGISFYTLKNEVISKWQLSPFKNLNTFPLKTNEELRKEYKDIYITSDGKKIVVRSLSSLMLWDIKKEKLIKSIKYKSLNAVTDGNRLFTIEKNGELIYDKWNPRGRLAGDIPIIDVWDMNTLTKIKSVNLFDLEGIKYKDRLFIQGGQLLVGEQTLFYFTSGGSNSHIMIIIDKATLKIKYLHSQIEKFIKTIDNKLIYKESEITHKANSFVSLEKVLDINTGEVIRTFPIKKMIGSNYLKKKDKYTITFLPEYDKNKIRTQSCVNNLILKYRNRKSNYVIYNVISGKSLASLYQFTDVEAVLINKEGYFETTKKESLYMKEKNKRGEITSIGNMTLQKYNKNLNIKGE